MNPHSKAAGEAFTARIIFTGVAIMWLFILVCPITRLETKTSISKTEIRTFQTEIETRTLETETKTGKIRSRDQSRWRPASRL
jgi:hypothetical protein